MTPEAKRALSYGYFGGAAAATLFAIVPTVWWARLVLAVIFAALALREAFLR